MKTPWPFVIAFALIFYANGAGFIESFVNYPSWRLVGADEFIAYHKFIGPRVIAYLVVPALLASLFTIALLWRRPAVVPLWAVWLAVSFQVTIWVSSAFIQIPIQVQFTSAGFSEERLASLITTNFWFRRVPNALTAVLFLWMMHRVVSTTQRHEVGHSGQVDR